jgi:hypothetical protein
MLRNYRAPAQLVVSRVALSSTELVTTATQCRRDTHAEIPNNESINGDSTAHTYEQQPNMVDDSSEMLTHPHAFLLCPVGCGLSDTSLVLGPIENSPPHVLLFKGQL